MKQLLLGGSANGADASTGAALDASFGVDFVLAIAFSDRADGALSLASTAADAIISNLVSHCGFHLLNNRYILNNRMYMYIIS